MVRKAETAPFRLEEDAEASALWTNASPLLKICSRVLSLGSQTKKQETPALLAGERLSWLGEERHYALKELRGLAKSAGRVCDALKRLGPGSTGSGWVECSHARECLPIGSTLPGCRTSGQRPGLLLVSRLEGSQRPEESSSPHEVKETHYRESRWERG